MLTPSKAVAGEVRRLGAAIALAFAVLAPSLPAQQTAAPSAPPLLLIDALRSGDSARWHALLRSGADTRARDGHGDTALHVAAYRGDAPAVEALLEHGAKPDALNDEGATALLYGAGSDEVVRALLAHGANPNLASKLGFTPLMAAAAHHDSHVTVARLLNAGADVHVKLKGQEIMALKGVYGGDPATLAMLLDHGASPQQTKGDEPSPLATAAYFDDAATMEVLLKHGADINFNADFAGHALNWALYSGHTALAAELIEKGSDLRFRSPWGHQTPPIVFAGYSEQGDPAIAKLLVARGADVNEANEQGATALTFALKSGAHTELVSYLEKAGAKPVADAPKSRTLAARRMPGEVSLRERLQRTIDLLQKGSNGFVDNRFVRDEAKCVSCHHQYLPAVAFAWGAKRGLRIDEESLGHQLSAQIAMWAPREESARQMEDPIPDSPVQVGYGLMCLKALGYAPDSMTEAYVRYLVNGQSPDGSWHWTDLRPPLEGGRITATAWAVRAIQLYPLPHSDEQVEACLSRARHWLLKAKPATFGDQASQLMGLAWAGESHWRLRSLGAAIVRMQSQDGGWSQLKDLESDAWATGEALFALREAAILSPADEAYTRGVQFLLKTQYDDGSWWVHSRTWPFQPHFDSGFPHGNDQWISAGATAWAAMALIQTMPEDPAARPLPSFGSLVASYSSAEAARQKAHAARTGTATIAVAAGPAVDFNRDVYPVLERSCVKCHSGEKPRARFSITSREALLKGGASGEPAVVPGKGGDSQLVVFASDEIEDLEMPPLKHRDEFPALSPSEIKKLQAWIDQGAAWNRAPPEPAATR
jgi:ankyrin repeat protein